MAFRSAIIIFIISLMSWSAIALTQQVDVIRPPQRQSPSWTKASWTYNDRELLPIRNRIESLWLTGKVTQAQVKELYDKNVAPYSRELQEGRYTKKVSVKPFFWLVALTAYFPNYKSTVDWSVLTQTGSMLSEAPIPPSYEFTRVGFCTNIALSPNVDKYVELGDRLLEKNSKDPLIRWYIARLGNGGNGYGWRMKRALTLAEQLNKEYPQLYQLFEPLLEGAYYISWGGSRNPLYLKKAIAMVDKALESSDPFHVGRKKLLQGWRKVYLERARKAGIKID